jgi:hypothetical protein
MALLVASISAVECSSPQSGSSGRGELAERRDVASEQARAGALVAKYRDPLLSSAFDLQSRIYNILDGGFAGRRDASASTHCSC